MSQLTPEERSELAYYAGYEPPQPVKPEPRFRLLRKLAAPLIALGALLAKFKFVFLALTKIKLFTTSGSMLVSIAAYSLVFGWKFAVGFVLLMLVHEMGHVIEARRQGIPISPVMFIPFLGAAIALKRRPVDAWHEALNGIAGPVLGSLGAAAAWGLGEALDSEFLVALAFTGFFLNLFNLLPIVPLDGGRIAAAIHPAMWVLGLAGLVVLLVLTPNPILILIVAFVGLEVWNRWRERGLAKAEGYYRIAPWQRVTMSVAFFGLALALALAMGATHVQKDF